MGPAAEVQALGRKALVVPTDVTRREDLKAMAEQTKKQFGRIESIGGTKTPLDVTALLGALRGDLGFILAPRYSQRAAMAKN